MSRIKFCGLSRACDIAAANELKPEYVGFVFAPKSKRCITPGKAKELKRLLADGIQAVGVFVNENPEMIADILNSGVIDLRRRGLYPQAEGAFPQTDNPGFLRKNRRGYYGRRRKFSRLYPA